MEIEVLRASEADIENIRTIAWKGWYPFYLQIISEEQIRFMYQTSYSIESLKKQMEEGHQFLILVADGKPAVMSSFGLYSSEEKTWKLHKLYADPAWAGKGLGKEMLNEVVKQVNQQGGVELQLNVNRKNPAFGFYLNCGFQVKWQEDIPFGPYWMNDYRMALQL